MQENGIKSGIWIIATGVIITGMYYGRDILAPFAMAVFLWLIMESFSHQIDRTFGFLPKWAARMLGILLVLFGFGMVVVFLAQGVESISGRSGLYESRINELIADIYRWIGLPDAPTLSKLLFGETGKKFIGSLASATGTLSESLIVVLIYVAFLFLAASAWPEKLDAIFPDPDNREQVRKVGADARRGIESYLWTQTVISIIITLLTYVTLVILGVQNAVLLAVLIFILNYIPTVGSIIAAVVPLMFALVQPEWPGFLSDNPYINAGIVFGAVSFWQFTIGNFIQPRLMGDSLNLSTLVVLLTLALWGAVWGIPGMFLSAPLTVVLMIIMNQFQSTKWIAILLSSNGKPDFRSS